MKGSIKCFIALSFACIVFSAKSQNFFVGLNLGMASNSLSANSPNDWYYSVNPKLGYRFSRKIVAGFESTVFSSHRQTIDKPVVYSQLNALGVFSRYLTNSKCLPFFEIKFSAGSCEVDNVKRSYMAFIISPGTVLLKKKKLEIDFMVDAAFGKLLDKTFDLYPKIGVSSFF